MASDATAKAGSTPKEKSDAGSNELKITPQLVVGLLVGLGCVPLAVLDEKVIAESFAPSSSATFAATKEAFIFAGACVGLCACIDFGFARWFGKEENRSEQPCIGPAGDCSFRSRLYSPRYAIATVNPCQTVEGVSEFSAMPSDNRIKPSATFILKNRAPQWAVTCVTEFCLLIRVL